VLPLEKGLGASGSDPLYSWGVFMTRKAGKTFYVLLIVVSILVLARLAAPYGIHRYVEHRLNQIPGYRTSVHDVDVNMLEGGYTLEGVRIEKVNGAVAEPLFEAERIESWTQWGKFDGMKPVGLMRMHRPVLTFVLADDEVHSQTGIDSIWLQKVDSLSPLPPNQSELYDGTIRLIDKRPGRPVMLFISDIQAITRNLANVDKVDEPLWADSEMTGAPMGHGTMTTRTRLNGLSPQPSFEMDSAIDNLPLSSLNDFFRAYANIDIEQGTLSSRTHISAQDGRFNAYMKPRYENLKTVSLEKDVKEKGFLGTLKEGIASVTAELTDQDDKSDPDDGVTLRLTGVVNADELRVDPKASLRSQFVRSIVPGSE
jgi:hypothetical protein